MTDTPGKQDPYEYFLARGFGSGAKVPDDGSDDEISDKVSEQDMDFNDDDDDDYTVSASLNQDTAALA